MRRGDVCVCVCVCCVHIDGSVPALVSIHTIIKVNMDYMEDTCENDSLVMRCMIRNEELS